MSTCPVVPQNGESSDIALSPNDCWFVTIENVVPKKRGWEGIAQRSDLACCAASAAKLGVGPGGRPLDTVLEIWGFPKMGYPQKWLVYIGKSPANFARLAKL